MATSPDLEALGATKPLLEAEEYDSYSWLLLEDHPLRSYPSGSDCHPDISAFTRKVYAIVRRGVRDRVLPLLSLLLMFLVIVQFLLQLPHVASYFLEPVHTKGLPEFIQTPITVDRAFDRAAACAFGPPSQPGGAAHNAIEHALSSGCTGVQVDVWQRHHDLLIGDSSPSLSSSNPGKKDTLKGVYLKSLQHQLDARNAASSNDSKTEKHDSEFNATPVGLFDNNPQQTFTIFLDVKTPMRKAWPVLVTQLKALNESGYLSYRNAEQELVLRPVTIVVSGRGCRRLSLKDDLSRVMKGLF